MMESEDETRDNTLIALATHFAKVQFRLKQIVSADGQRKEDLLKELEEFAFQGCPGSMTYDTAAAGENGSTEAQRQRRSDLMEKLRDQLRDLEECARSVENEGSGEDEGRSGRGTDLAQKQHLIIEELRRRFDLQFGDLESMSTEEVKKEVSKAVKGIESKKDLVTQLTTQVSDLHRYIAYLRDDQTHRSVAQPLRPSLRSASPLPSARPKHVSFADEREEDDSCSSSSGLPQFRPLHTSMVASRASPDPGPLLGNMSDSGGVQCSVDSSEMAWMGDSTPLYQCKAPDDLRLSLLVMRKTLTVMQMLTLWQCGGSFHCLPRYVADGHRKRYHSALRCLEVAVDRIAILTTSLADPGLSKNMAVALETDLHEEVSMSLADSLRVLLEHGLINGGGGAGPGKGCVSVWGSWGRATVADDKDCPAWRVFQFYYGVKNGNDYSTKPDQLLSSSFSLPIGSSSSIKKTLLAAIFRVENTYVNCRNMSKDTKFRALVCEGFNLCHLAEWFRIVATHPTVADELYTSSSFLASTGFRPAIAYLENLKDNPSCQPVELPSDYYHSANAFQASN